MKITTLIYNALSSSSPVHSNFREAFRIMKLYYAIEDCKKSKNHLDIIHELYETPTLAERRKTLPGIAVSFFISVNSLIRYKKDYIDTFCICYERVTGKVLPRGKKELLRALKNELQQK